MCYDAVLKYRCALIQFYRLFVFLVFLNGICGHKCYVCKEDCELFNVTTKFKYEQECPATSTTCRAEIRNGSVILRSCEDEHNYLLNDCQPLNGIKYCYCSKELCNDMSKDNLLDDKRHAVSDDEDEFEGSAISKIDDVITVLQPITPQDNIKIAKSSNERIPKNSFISALIIIPISQYYRSMV